jgi:hypothetical protein
MNQEIIIETGLKPSRVYLERKPLGRTPPRKRPRGWMDRSSLMVPTIKYILASITSGLRGNGLSRFDYYHDQRQSTTKNSRARLAPWTGNQDYVLWP